MLHPLSYQQARIYNLPVEGVYLAQVKLIDVVVGPPQNFVQPEVDMNDPRNLPKFKNSGTCRKVNDPEGLRCETGSLLHQYTASHGLVRATTLCI